MHLVWRANRYKIYLGNGLLWYCFLELSFVYKIVSQFLFNLLCFSDKRFLSKFMKIWSWFQRHDVCFPENIDSRLKFKKKTEALLCRWNSNDCNDVKSSCHWKTLVPFCLRKTKPENLFLKRTVNCRKVIQKSNLYYLEQQY